MKSEFFEQLKKSGELIYDYDYQAYYYPEWDSYYNQSGQELRHKDEYNQYSEGYTPFGDE